MNCMNNASEKGNGSGTGKGRSLRLLSDQPAFKDRFGTHTTLAKVLKQIIEEITKPKQEHKDRDDKVLKNVIALFGSWGSGKSTVINILEDKFGGNLTIFRFDSWSHKDEHLKRAFLLSLSRFLDVNPVLENVEKKRPDDRDDTVNVRLSDVLSGEYKKIQPIPNRPKISGGLFVIGILILASLILTILNGLSPVYGAIKLNEFLKDHIYLALGIVIALLICILLIMWRKRDVLYDSILAPLLHLPLKVREASAEYRDILSIRFREYLDLIVREWSGNNSNKLIIILDNLDRVSDEMVSRFFSLIQSALDAPGSQEKIVFIVPIDRSRVLQVLGGMIRSHPEPLKNSSPIESSAIRSIESYEKDFLKKLFPYSLEVPELLGSNWRTFFKEKFIEVFPWMGKESAEISLITGMFHQVLSAKNSITPREIIHFINEMAVNACLYESVKNSNDRSKKPQNRNLSSEDVVLVALYTAIKRYDSYWFSELFRKNTDEQSQPQQNTRGSVKDNSQNGSLLKSFIDPYIGTLISENYQEELLYLHYLTIDVWDLLFSKPLLDILNEGGDRAHEIIKDKIEAKLANLRQDRKHMLLREILEKILKDSNAELSSSPVKIGRFMWILLQLKIHEEGFRQQLLALLLRSVRQDSPELKTLDITAREGLLHILTGDFPEKTELLRNLAQHFIRIFDEFIENMKNKERST